jgi:uncharacterized protein (DUF305 family)
MNAKTILVGAAAVVAVGVLAYTQLPKSDPDPMAGMDHSTMTMTPASVSASTKAYEGAMTSMMKGMMVPLTGKPDVDFMQGMMPHHQGAIDMAKAVLQYGKDPEVKTLAENVIKAQEGEIAFMKDWLGRVVQSSLVVSPESAKGNEQAMGTMMKNMAVPYTGDADADFLKSMIPHHQGAIDMAKVALQFAKDPEVLKLAQDVVTAQESEIAFMTGWLAKNGK